MSNIRILAVDQARHGGWAVYDYDNKELIDHGTFFVNPDLSFEDAIYQITNSIWMIICDYNVDAVFFEDTQYQKNIDSFKKLCWLQGALIHMFKDKEMLYAIIPPSRWQGFCNARGRSSSEIKEKITKSEDAKRKSKALTIEYVKEKFNIDTTDDNLADAICIGFYVVNNIVIQKGN